MIQDLSKLIIIVKYKVNRRGDGILHLAVCSGKDFALSKLLSSVTILATNQINDRGETPLLCVCRAGQLEAV